MREILVDSSAWIEYFKNRDFLFIDTLLDENQICTNDVVLAELLPSIMHKKEYHLARLLGAIKKYEMAINWNEIRNFQRENLKHGNHTVPLADLLIAQNCMQNGMEILTADRHFEAVSKYLPLRMCKNL